MNIEERFHNYFNLGLIGMAVTSLDKNWVEVNDKLCEIFGYRTDELLKLTWPEITHPDDLEADVSEFERVLAGKIDGYSMDKRFFRKDGTIIYATISVNCIRKKNGTADHFVAFVQDITERKTAELKLSQMNDELEKLVAYRTRELEAVNKQLEASCDTDFLTQLPNRRFYERRLQENISTAKRNNSYLSLLMIDIDNFKAYNDKYGHDDGDLALLHVASCIKNSLQRDTDLVARFGGEEFIVLLPSTDSINAMRIAEQIRVNIEQLDIEHKLSEKGIVTVSIGLEALKGESLEKISLFKHADLALYFAKNTGKNSCYLYQSR